MHYLFESSIVGLYCVFLYSILHPIPHIFLLFSIGFIKQYSGYIVHDYYCKYGDACIQLYIEHTKNKHIILESFLEGCVFIIVGEIVFKIIPIRDEIFIIGFSLYSVSEIIGLHNYFCKNRYN